MALSDMVVLQEYTRSTYAELLADKIDLFNEASRGTITLTQAVHEGDFSDKILWKRLDNLVRRRNPYNTGAVSVINLQNITDTMVRVAAGTPPVNLPPSMFAWLQTNPKEAGVVIGENLAQQMLADQLDIALGALGAVISTNAAMTNDISAGTGGAQLPTTSALTDTAMKFGDAYQSILAWVMHSTPLAALFKNNLTNPVNLFTYGTVTVVQDPFGRPYICADNAALRIAGSPVKYRTLGLTAGAFRIEDNTDYTANLDTRNGDENIQRTWQAEWSYEAGMKGHQWDKTNGGKAPTTAALKTATNWDKYVQSDKDGPGVLLLSQ